MSEARAEYEKRLKGHEAELAVFEGRHRRFGDAKLAVIAAGIMAAWNKRKGRRVPELASAAPVGS